MKKFSFDDIEIKDPEKKKKVKRYLKILFIDVAFCFVYMIIQLIFATGDNYKLFGIINLAFYVPVICVFVPVSFKLTKLMNSDKKEEKENKSK